MDTTADPLTLDPWQTRRRMAVFLLGLGLILMGCAWRLYDQLQDDYRFDREVAETAPVFGYAVVEPPPPSNAGPLGLLISGGALVAAGGLMAIVAPPRASL